jgi:hypothetical protein
MNNSIPVSEAIKTDPEVRETVSKIQSGEISLCAPFPGMEKPWTEVEKAELAAALRNYGWK